MDDDLDVVNGMARILRSRGYSVIQATDGFHAVELARAHSARVVVSDIQMPVMNGIETCRQIRQHCPDTAVIFMTGFSEFEKKAREEGAVAILRKPVEFERLFELLESLTELQDGSSRAAETADLSCAFAGNSSNDRGAVNAAQT